MKLKTLMIINTIVTLVFGIAFVLIPWEVYKIYGPESNDVLNYMGELFGAALIGLGVISWRAKNAESSESLNAIILGFLIGDFVGFIVALIAQLNNVVNIFGWTTVLIYLLLDMGFVYFYFSKNTSK